MHRHENLVSCHGTLSECVFCCVFLTAFSSAVVLNSPPVAYNSVGGSRHHPATVYTSSACDDCAARKLAEQDNSEEYRYARIELIKQQILKKLRLREPPNVRIPRSVLPSVLADKDVLLSQTEADDSSENSRRQDDFYGTMQTAVIFPQNDSHECITRGPHPGSCFVFHLSAELTSRSVAHAELWVFKDLDPAASSSAVNHTFVVSELSVVGTHRSNRHHPHHTTPRKSVVAFESSSSKPEWLRFDLTSLVADWAGRRNRPRKLEISCKTCSNLRNVSPSPSPSGTPIGSTGEKQPFLVVRTDPNASGPSRSRRSIDCNGSISRCCRESFYVSFKEIGWDSWIIQPAGYSANFCRGSCIHDISVNKYHHTTVLQRFLHSAAAAGVNNTLKLSLCCTPSRLSSISLIFIDEDQVLKQKSLPNMVVEACECA